MTHQPNFATSDTDFKHCQTLATRIILRAVLDLNSPNEAIKNDASFFLDVENSMFLFYVSIIASEYDDARLAKEIINFARVGDESPEIMQQRAIFGDRFSQMKEKSVTNNKLEAVEATHDTSTYSRNNELGF